MKRWVGQFHKEGLLRSRKKGGGTPSDVSLPELETLVSKLGDATAGELTAAYNRGRRGKQRRHRSSIVRALQRAEYVVKKAFPATRATPPGRHRQVGSVPPSHPAHPLAKAGLPR